ncbi:MAG: Sec-independent protein translocase TatB [Pseudonocardiales bacterium]|nr:Sec-independent protein translocase subunit TatB [Pseudonocardiales bacterium]PZS21422.1 MAG: Sec-independent protein translocase TatB [Pseudonocardiales bacterium]
MFNIGWGEFLILIVAGLLILGPERLPSAAAWLGRTVRQVREYANGAREQLRSELGPEFDELRAPLEDLRGLRSFNPRGFNPTSAITRHLFDDLGAEPFGGVPEPLKGNVSKPNGYAAPTGRGTPISRPLQPGERAPFDPDAT